MDVPLGSIRAVREARHDRVRASSDRTVSPAKGRVADQDLFLRAAVFWGALPPARRACASPIAIACFPLVTFLPERPLRSMPRLRSRIACLTFCDAFLPYLAIGVSRAIAASGRAA